MRGGMMPLDGGMSAKRVVSAADPDPPLTGLVARFRADTDVTDAGAGKVSDWGDMSAGGFDLTQGTAGQRPTLVTGVINGQPVIRFDSANAEKMARSTTPTDNQPFSLVAICAHDSDDGWMWGANNGFRCLGTFSDTPTIFAGSFVDNGTPISAGTFFTFIGNFNGASSEIVIDGSATTVNANTGNLDGGLIVGSGPGGSDQWSGDIAELFVYDHALDAGEVTTMAAYVAARYGL